MKAVFLINLELLDSNKKTYFAVCVNTYKNSPFKLENNKPIIDILTETKIASSRREAREFLNNNAITLNGEIINDENYIVDNVKKYNIIRKGKKKYFVLER